MVYGEEKSREMARSLLPSKNREAARKSRVSIQQGRRRRSRMQEARLTRELEDSEDFSAIDSEADARLRVMVRRRRDGDKLGPFFRWAKAVARPVPQEHRLAHIRALVPRGVIGDHALRHLSSEREFEHPTETARLQALMRTARKNRSSAWLDRGEQAELLRAVLRAPGGHRAFNQWLRVTHITEYRKEKRRRPCPCAPGCSIVEEVDVPVGPTRARMLQGVHDVLPFIASLWGAQRAEPWLNHPRGPSAEQAESVDTFLVAFKKHRGDVMATRGELRLEARMNWKAHAARLSPDPR